MRNMQILGTGVAVPARVVTSDEIDQAMGYREGFTEKLTGVVSRHYVTHETASDMACEAINDALKQSGLSSLDEIDCIIAASATMERAIPYNAATIHSKLNLPSSTPSFDINMTCLSALMAFDVAANMLSIGQYKTILVVSSDIASVGVEWNNIETGGIFGDGAAAVIFRSSEDMQQGVIASHFETYSEGVDLCVIQGGGTRLHPRNVEGDYGQYGMFEMQGRDVYRLATRHITRFLETLFEKASVTLNNIDWVVPHQASHKAISHLHKILKIDPTKIIDIISTRGNQIASSIPTALHELVHHRDIQKGDKVLVLGTSAGMSIGGMVVEY